MSLFFRLSPFSERPLFLFLSVLLACGGVSLNTAHAQGFGVYEQGTCFMGRAGAGVAHGCDDGSSMFFNPANVVGNRGLTVSIGGTLINASGEFTYDYTTQAPYTGVEVELQNNPIPVPHAYLTYGRTETLGFGFGLYVPYGLETNWPVRLLDGSYFDGAFEGFKNRVQAVYLQPTVSYQVTPRLRIGGGPVLAISSVELNQLQDLSQTAIPNTSLQFSQLGIPFHTPFARSSLESSNELGFGANLGASFRLSDRLTLGARFTTPIAVSYEGQANFLQIQTGLTVPTDLTRNGQVVIPAGTPLDVPLSTQFSGDGLLTTQAVETEITFPMQLVGGISYRATDALLRLADYQFTGWSAFDEIRLNFEKLGERTRKEGYENTHALRLGAEYEVVAPLTARVGYLYNTAAAPDEGVTPLLPESDRNQFTVGIGWSPIESLNVNVAYQLLQQNDRRGRVRGALPNEEVTTDLNQGLYSFGAHLLGTTLTLRF